MHVGVHVYRTRGEFLFKVSIEKNTRTQRIKTASNEAAGAKSKFPGENEMHEKKDGGRERAELRSRS